MPDFQRQQASRKLTCLLRLTVQHDQFYLVFEIPDRCQLPPRLRGPVRSSVTIRLRIIRSLTKFIGCQTPLVDIAILSIGALCSGPSHGKKQSFLLCYYLVGHTVQILQAAKSKGIQLEALDFLNFALSSMMDDVVSSARQSA